MTAGWGICLSWHIAIDFLSTATRRRNSVRQTEVGVKAHFNTKRSLDRYMLSKFLPCKRTEFERFMLSSKNTIIVVLKTTSTTKTARLCRFACKEHNWSNDQFGFKKSDTASKDGAATPRPSARLCRYRRDARRKWVRGGACIILSVKMLLTPPLPLPYKGGEWLHHPLRRCLTF